MKALHNAIKKPVSIAPLVMFRIIFGAVMFISIARFAWKGWIGAFYIEPNYFFTYYGFDWIQPLGEWGMYAVFALMAVAALCILTGCFYRIAAITFFLLFTYVELLDKTYYLNHYYFISLVSFLMIWLPANRNFSVDARRNPALRSEKVPAWSINILKLQLGIVYFFAGIAKINPDWLLEALPLKIWLPAHSDWPIIGQYFNELWVAYGFSWFGMLYDITIPFLLLNNRTRIPAYGFVIIFHIATRMLFPIGMFPYIMIGLTLIFFSEQFHEKCLQRLSSIFGRVKHAFYKNTANWSPKPIYGKLLVSGLAIFFLLQIIIPFRYTFYPGKLFWTEQGYRFSWRVMLMEKSGMCTFVVREKDSQPMVIDNEKYLTRLQERMMATQPDMILQFAHYIRDKFAKDGLDDPKVYADCYVSLQGHRGKTFINPDVNLAKQKRSFKHKNWILPFNEE